VSPGRQAREGSAGAVIAVVAAVLVGGAYLVTSLLSAGQLRRSAKTEAATPPVWRELVVMRLEDGKVTYEVSGGKVRSEADLTNELKKVRLKYELRRGDGIVADFIILSVVRRGEAGLTGEHYERARAACLAAGARPEGLDKPPAPDPLEVDVSLDDAGLARYRCGKAIDALGERELGRQVAEIRKQRGEVRLAFSNPEPFAGLTQKHFAAARKACETAGAVVTEMPEKVAPFDHDGEVTLGGHSLEVRAIGVRSGLLQFRLDRDGPVVFGDAELTAAIRRIIDAEEEKSGGIMMFNVGYQAVPEMVIPDEQHKITKAAMKAAGPEVRFPFGYRDGGGRVRSIYVKLVRVLIVDAAASGQGSRYLVDGQPAEGEDGLRAALAGALAAWRAGKENPGLYTLRTELKVEVKPGVTATEEQIALAREALETAGSGRPERKP
jgi:hypothetical protein